MQASDSFGSSIGKIELHVWKSMEEERVKLLFGEDLYSNEEERIIFLNTGITGNLTMKELSDTKSIITNVENKDYPEVLIDADKVKGVRICGYIEKVKINNIIYSNKRASDLYIDLESGVCYKCFFGEVPGYSYNLPTISEELMDLFISSVKEYFLPYFCEHMNVMRNTPVKNTQEIREGHGDAGSTSEWVSRAKNIHLVIYPDNSHPDAEPYSEERDEEIYFSVCVSITSTPVRTFIGIPYLMFPKDMRRKGIYTGLLILIKEFMDEHNLGDCIAVIDNSDDGATFRVSERIGLRCDPFMYERYGLVTYKN